MLSSSPDEEGSLVFSMLDHLPSEFTTILDSEFRRNRSDRLQNSIITPGPATFGSFSNLPLRSFERQEQIDRFAHLWEQSPQTSGQRLLRLLRKVGTYLQVTSAFGVVRGTLQAITAELRQNRKADELQTLGGNGAEVPVKKDNADLLVS